MKAKRKRTIQDIRSSLIFGMKSAFFPGLVMISVLLSFVACGSSDKNSDADLFVQNILKASMFTDTGDTVIMPSTGLEWKKCSQGQAFLTKLSNCQGNYNPVTQDGLYGALVLQYCNANDHSCNTQSLPMTLTAPINGATSTLYNSCTADTTGGYTDWRVPSHIELIGILNTKRSAMLTTFPDTIDGFYWSSDAYLNPDNVFDPTLAYAVSFRLVDYGQEAPFSKTTSFYVHCVRNAN